MVSRWYYVWESCVFGWLVVLLPQRHNRHWWRKGQGLKQLIHWMCCENVFEVILSIYHLCFCINKCHACTLCFMLFGVRAMRQRWYVRAFNFTACERSKRRQSYIESVLLLLVGFVFFILILDLLLSLDLLQHMEWAIQCGRCRSWLIINEICAHARTRIAAGHYGEYISSCSRTKRTACHYWKSLEVIMAGHQR